MINLKDLNNQRIWKNSITDVPGVKVGHSQDLKSGTGCTVVIFEKGAITGVDVRGGAPGTRETDLLNPVNMIEKAQAIYLSGGSAFGLDGVTGVMQYLENQGIGFDVGFTKVPIVPAAVLFDLGVGDFKARPNAEMGYNACINASNGEVEQGNVGAGTGATVGKVLGSKYSMKSGIGTSSIKYGDLIIGAIVAVNSFGDIIDPKYGKIIAGALTEDKRRFVNTISYLKKSSITQNDIKGFPSNTTIGLIVTNAKISKAGATKIAMMAQNGLARTIVPVHTMFDGDTIFCSGTCAVDADINLIGIFAADLMAQSVINAVKNAESLYGLPSYKELLQSPKNE